MPPSKFPVSNRTVKLRVGRKKFILLTTSISGLELAKGLIDTGHLLVKVGVGTTGSANHPIGAIGF